MGKMYPLAIGSLVCLARFGIAPFDPCRAAFLAHVYRGSVVLEVPVSGDGLENMASAIAGSRPGLLLAERAT